MEAAYLFRGDACELAKTIREQRVRVSRGLFTITPVDITEKAPAAVADVKADIPADDKTLGNEDCKDVSVADTKAVKKTSTRSKK